jgi:putative chitinase
LLSAAWFWSKNKLNEIADGGPTDEVVAKVTKRVNGGNIGLDQRIKEFKHFYSLLS